MPSHAHMSLRPKAKPPPMTHLTINEFQGLMAAKTTKTPSELEMIRQLEASGWKISRN